METDEEKQGAGTAPRDTPTGDGNAGTDKDGDGGDGVRPPSLSRRSRNDRVIRGRLVPTCLYVELAGASMSCRMWVKWL